MSLRSLKKSIVAADEIRALYFGQGGRNASKKPSSGSSRLTPTAQFVVQEAKRQLGTHSASNDDQIPSTDDLTHLIQQVESQKGELLTNTERDAVLGSLVASLTEYDVLTPLVNNPEVNDIIVRSYNDISVQSGRRNIQSDLKFASHDAYKSFIENLLKLVGKSCTTATPVVDAALNSHVRVCVTHESFSPRGSGPMLTLRVARHRDISLAHLVHHELAPQIMLDYLATLVQSGEVTMLIAGEVGTGKTTLVRALMNAIASDEALLIIEDTHELVLNRPFTRTLLTREANTEGVGRITPAQAIRTGMRMAMNRVVLGEMRDADAAEAFIDVCASGHPGISTIHARSAKDALSRLELFLARAQGSVDIPTIRRQIANALSVVVFLGLDPVAKRRRIVEILEVEGSADGAVQVSPIFSIARLGPTPEWKRDAGISQYHDYLTQHEVALPHYSDHFGLDPDSLYRGIQHTGTTSGKLDKHRVWR